jgi:aminoglycoside phosphotransferase family enzyme/predicted kinase
VTDDTSTGAPTPYAEVRETHTGVVVLVGDRAYKGKKAITTDFLDHTTPERRERSCGREVELNRRLAPDTYLGVAHLSDPSGGPAEPIVVMRRYPDACRLATRVRNRESVTSALERVADELARFHDGADRGRAIDEQGTVGAVGARWQENIGELKRFVGTVLPADKVRDLEDLATQYIAGRSVLFTTRVEDRCIVDGHGDLLADDIFCLPDGEVAILDCLEFDDALRHVDVIDDAAFLAMDLEFLDSKELADDFLAKYTRLSGDAAPSSLTHFYIAYRAVVRAKVDCIRVGQGHPEAAQDAVRHLDIAIDHLRAGAVRLVLVGGGPGTGKTTLAHRLAESVGAQVVATDEMRRELQRSGIVSGEPGVLDRGLYSPENVGEVYHAVLRHAHLLLAGGRSVILDGTWRDPRHREAARQLASDTHSALAEILCVASVETAAARVADRPGGVSDATPAIAEALDPAGRDWRDAFRLDTNQQLADSVREAETLWRDMV